MTQEEKARAYDKALESATIAYKDKDRHLKATLERIFPELKESEDERISKEIIKYLEQTVPHHHRDEVLKSKEWIAWLEKQGEHNKNHKTMIVKFICKKDWHGIGDYYYGKIYNGYPCEKEQKGYDIYDDNHVPTFCDEDFINEYFNIVTEEKQDEPKSDEWSEEDEKMCQETIDWFEKKCFPYALESENPARESIKWLKSLKQRIGG